MKTATMKSESIHTGSKTNPNTQSTSAIRPRFQLAIAIAAMLWLAASAASAQTVLYTFNNETGDVDAPEGALIADGAGNLYGTAWSGGPALLGGIFELSPPTVPGGPWTEQTLYDFAGGADGGQPAGSLVMDASGNLYGTTTYYGTDSEGLVFELSPPTVQGGSWTKTSLYNFTGGNDGSNPNSTLVFDKSGNLYGTTYQGGSSDAGVVFQMSPPSISGGTWGFNVLLNFSSAKDAPGGCNPSSGLLLAPSGSFFGTTLKCGAHGGGVVFQLVPPVSGGSWTENVIHTFGFLNGKGDGTEPLAPPITGAGGALFGTTSEGGSSGLGTIYELTPPTTKGGKWTETVLLNFDSTNGSTPYGGVVASGGGALYGTTAGGGASFEGVAFKLTPPIVSGGSWTETPLITFSGATGESPRAGLLPLKGALYGTASVGGGPGSVGTVFKIF